MTVKLEELLEHVSERTREKLSKQPEVVMKDGSFDPEDLPINAAKWYQLSDVVAVVFDMRASTELERGRSAASTASIYDAGVGGVVKILNDFGADFVDIQGDGGFGLFWGELRYERAMCAGITIRTFSSDFTEQIESKWANAPSTGFKVGIASSSIMAKRVGLARHLNMQEPVWAGHAVNYAAKAAQQTDPKVLLVTASVWDQVQDNDYLAFSCGCNGAVADADPTLLWEDRELEKIPDDEKFGQALASSWCTLHGQEFCNRILDGYKTRSDVSAAVKHERNLLGSGSGEKLEMKKHRQQQRSGLEAQLAEALRHEAGLR